jgi:hypothetical protein
MAVSAQAEQQQIIRERDAQIAKINGYVDLTQDAKDQRINEVKQWAASEVRAIREEESRRIQERLESTRRAVFGVPGGHLASDAERAQIMASFRAAWSEVLSASEVEESFLLPEQQQRYAEEKLAPILEQAERTGDTLLARAVYHRGIDLGAQGIVNKYLSPSTRKTEATQWQRYTEAVAEAEQASSFESLLDSAMMDRQFAS